MSSAATRNLRDGKLKIVDGTPVTPLTLDVEIDEGNLSFTEHDPSTTIKNRGRLDHRRDADEMEVDVSFEIKFQQWQAHDIAAGSSPVDALKKRGGASAWLTVGQSWEPYCVNLEFRVKNPNDASNAEKLTFTKFHVESLAFKEGDDCDKVTVSGKAFTTTVARTYGTNS